MVFFDGRQSQVKRWRWESTGHNRGPPSGWLLRNSSVEGIREKSWGAIRLRVNLDE